MIRTLPKSLVTATYVVPGLPHTLLASEKSPAWKSLNESYAQVRKEIEESDAEMILYWSSQWLSVLGYLFMADPNPEWIQVDHNWHEYGSIPYNFKVDAEFAHHFASEVKGMGHYVREVKYRGFPIDTGTIVAQKLLNPNNRIPAAMASCNMYAEKQETLSIGQAAARALEAHGKKTIVVMVSSLSARFETKEINPREDKISSLKDDEWNRKILDLLGEGRLEDVSEVAREYSRQANADMGFRGIWWLNGLCGKHNEFTGRVFDYQPIWGSGAGLVGLYPKKPIRPIPGWVNDEADLVERMSATSKAAPASGASMPSMGGPVGESDSADQVRTSFKRKDAYSPGGTVGLGADLAERVSESEGTRGDAKRSPVNDTQKIVTFEASQGAGKINSSQAPPPVGPYPHARRVGDFVYLSGVGPRQAGTKVIPGVTTDSKGKVIAHDVEVQTRAVIENIIAILNASGCTLTDVVDVQVYLTHMAQDFQKFNKVYAEYFSSSGPTRTTIEVTSLPTPIAVELKVVAYKPL